ncbi:MAG TPA: hypothetical protein VMV86_01080, partial [Methanosarcinales archaeon]|nr:hypothetical protein [Methanosarcinales archaeon]
MKISEKTGNQTISISYAYDGKLLIPNYALRGTYTQLRAIRKDPTVSLARQLVISAIQAGSWNIEADEGVGVRIPKFLEHVLKLRDDLIMHSVAYGKIDFGWIGFEKIFKVVDDRITIDSLKPLLHDITAILVTPKGYFNGYRQNPMTGTPVDVEAAKCLHIAFGVEAGNLYGMPLLENIRQAMDAWTEC